MPEDFKTERTKALEAQGGPDVAAMSDVAKRAQLKAAGTGLQQVFDGAPGSPPSAASQMPQTAPVSGSLQEQMSLLTQRIVELDRQIGLIQQSGTGNMGAIQTYQQVRSILMQRLASVQQQLQAESAGTSQTPAPPQNAAMPAGGTGGDQAATQPNTATPGVGR